MPSKSPQDTARLAEAPIEKRRVIYDLDTGVRVKEFEVSGGKPPSVLAIPVQKWTMRAPVIIPADEDSRQGPVQIASVPVPLSMAVGRSIFGQDKKIYVQL